MLIALRFRYFPAQNADPRAPLILWLQVSPCILDFPRLLWFVHPKGGPGASSLFGLFGEFGPITVDKDLKPQPKPFTWNAKYSLIFVDQPAGTGYSQVGSAGAVCTRRNCRIQFLYRVRVVAAGTVNNSPQGARELLEALKQFFTVFNELRSCALSRLYSLYLLIVTAEQRPVLCGWRILVSWLVKQLVI